MFDLPADDLVNFGLVNQSFLEVATPYLGAAKAKVRAQKMLYDRLHYIDKDGLTKESIHMFGLMRNNLKLKKFSIETGTHLTKDILCDAMDIVVSLLHKPHGHHYPIERIDKFLNRDDLFDIKNEAGDETLKIFQTVVSIHTCLYTFMRHDHPDLQGVHYSKRGIRIQTVGDQIICALQLKYMKMAMDACRLQCSRESLQHMITITTIFMNRLSRRGVSPKVNTFLTEFMDKMNRPQ